MTDSSDASPPRAAVRTYGKRAAAGGEQPVVAPSVTRVSKDPSPEPAPFVSPSKTLLNKFTQRNDDWLDSTRGDLAMEPSSTDDNAEPTEEEMRAQMLRMKSNFKSIAAGRPIEAIPPSRALFGSSSLSSLPPSSPPLPPPKPARRSSLSFEKERTEREASPPAVARFSPSPKRVVTTRIVSLLPSSPPRSQASTTESPVPVSRRTQRIIESASGDENSDSDATPKAKPVRPRLSFELADDDQAEDTEMEDREAPALSIPPASGLGDLFDDDDEDIVAQMSLPKSGKLKQLSKANMEEMHRDIARAQREKTIGIARPEAKQRPISQWMARANEVTNPSSQPRTSPHPMSDDIQPFTPSSGPMHRSAPAGPNSSPTMEKQKRLAAVKQALIAHRKKNPPILELNSEDDDGLDVVDEEDAKGKLSFTPSHRKVPDARMALSRASGAAAPSRARQQISRFAGKAAAKHSITETHADFAGRQFSHAQLKNANGRSRPAGQKKGRDEVITHGQVDNQNLARHMEHVHKIKQSKEQLYGSSRELPAKRALDITTLVSSSHESAKGNAASDDDDSDFAPSGDEEGSDAEDLGTGPSAIQDTLPEDDEQEDEDGNADEDEDKENQPVPVVEQDDEEENPFKARATATRRRQVVTSDDEGDGQDQVRDTSLREAVKSQPTKAQTQIAGGDDRFGEEIDFGGFGSAGGGFSQLFGATQAPDGGDDADAFAALRNAPELPLLPEHALLPSVRISETQKRRDDALIAGEFENASLPTPKTVKKKQYLNSQGFFTQTVPLGRELSKTASVEDLPDEDSPMNSKPPKASSTIINSTEDPPSPTQEQSFTRLRRRRSPTTTSPPPEPAPKTAPRNAFDILQRGAATEAAKGHQRSKPAFLDEQAEESDDDNGWGFNGGNDDDDEEGLDTGYIPELLDDKEMDEEEKQRDADLAAAKFREVAQADDARREAEAKKVTEGHLRQKRRGNEFFSEDEDEDGRPRKWTKKQRRQRRLERDDGLFKLGDEANVFVQAYEEDLDTDNEDDEAPPSPTFMSPIKATTAQERMELLRARARVEVTETEQTILFADEEVESQYNIRRTVVSFRQEADMDDHDEPSWSRGLQRNGSSAGTRSIENYSKFVSDESINPRRAAGVSGGVSVVSRPDAAGRRPRPHRTETANSSSTSDSRSISRQGSSVLLDRNKRFG